MDGRCCPHSHTSLFVAEGVFVTERERERERERLSLTSLKKKSLPHLLSTSMGVETEVIAGLPLAELAGLWVEPSVDISLPVEPFRCCILRFLLDNRLKIEI